MNDCSKIVSSPSFILTSAAVTSDIRHGPQNCPVDTSFHRLTFCPSLPMLRRTVAWRLSIEGLSLQLFSKTSPNIHRAERSPTYDARRGEQPERNCAKCVVHSASANRPSFVLRLISSSITIPPRRRDWTGIDETIGAVSATAYRMTFRGPGCARYYSHCGMARRRWRMSHAPRFASVIS